jgi:hypothetical protein
MQFGEEELLAPDGDQLFADDAHDLCPHEEAEREE